MEGGHVIDVSDVLDPTISALWKHIFSFLDECAIIRGMAVCKTFKAELPLLVKSININQDWDRKSAQRTLDYISETFKNLEVLEISPEYHDFTPKFDFRHLKFPELRVLNLRCARLRTLNFTTANTPKSSDLNGLKLWAPKLACLELQSCHRLECVRIMPDPEDIEQITPLQVNLIHANIDRVSKQHLKNHPRVKAPGGKLIKKEDEDTTMPGEGGNDEDTSSQDDSGDEDGGLGFMPMMPMVY